VKGVVSGQRALIISEWVRERERERGREAAGERQWCFSISRTPMDQLLVPTKGWLSL